MRVGLDPEAPARRRIALPFVVTGAVAVILGGLVAAVTRPLDLADGSWLAAFLVLVLGVAQIALGCGRAWLPVDPPRNRRRVMLELITWNAGCLVVILGTLVGSVWVVAVGSLGVLVAAALFAVAVLSTADAGADGRASGDPHRTPRPHRSLHAAYLGFVALLAVSVVVGVGLSLARHA